MLLTEYVAPRTRVPKLAKVAPQSAVSAWQLRAGGPVVHPLTGQVRMLRQWKQESIAAEFVEQIRSINHV